MLTKLNSTLVGEAHLPSYIGYAVKWSTVTVLKRKKKV